MHTMTLEDNRILRELGDLVDDRVAETLEDYLAEGRLVPPGPDRTARLAARVALAMTAALVAWSTVLSVSLPATEVSQHWRLVWVGLDVAMAVGAGATALLVLRGDRRAALAAMATATLLAFDAWFDVCTSGAGPDHTLAVAEAVVLEIPLAIAGFCLALRQLR